MSNSNTIDSVSTILADYFYKELVKSEDFALLETLMTTDIRTIGANALCKCLVLFDNNLRKNIPRGWSTHGKDKRTLITLTGTITFERTIFLDEYGRHRALLDELLGIPKNSRFSAGAFLWIARCASELSYRKTARAFEELTGTTISHVSVKNIVLKEGKLLKDTGGEFAREGTLRISQDKLFIESDGLWVHLQSETHKEVALPRFLYEQSRKAKSFELKIAVVYAGKRQVAPGRFERGGLCATCLDGTPDNFWERIYNMTVQNFEPDDIEQIEVGGDGAKWCDETRIEAMVSANCKVTFALDLFHIMKCIIKAFPKEDSNERMWAINLLMRGCGKKLAKMCERIARKMHGGKAKEKVEKLAKYIGEHIRGIRVPTHEMGTMEGTNAHIGAARLKGHGRSWSRRGAEAMCLIRCALFTGRKLIAPVASSWFSERELKVKEDALPKSASEIPVKVGSGYEPPIQQAELPKKAAIALRCS